MEFLGIGAPELVFIIVIALILLGPKDMQKAGRTIGAWLNQMVRSDWWRAVRRTSEELRTLPTNLMREANREMAELDRDLRKAVEPPSIGGPRVPGSNAPVSPLPPPKPDLRPTPPVGTVRNPPETSEPAQPPDPSTDNDIHSGPKTANPPDQGA